MYVPMALVRRWAWAMQFASAQSEAAKSPGWAIQILGWLTAGQNTFISKYFFVFVLAGGRCPPDPPIFGWGGKAPPDPPLNGRSSHLIEAAKRGRLDQMIFFSAPLTTRAPPTTVRRPSDDPQTLTKNHFTSI